MKNHLRSTQNRHSIPLSRRDVKEHFRDFAFLVTGEILMHLVAFMDESGHHDRSGFLPGSGQPTIAGIAAPVVEWEFFCQRWNDVLRKYSVPFFHFYEWAEASRVFRGKRVRQHDFEQNVFCGWNVSQMDSFLHELAEVTGEGDKVLVGGGIVSEGDAPLEHLLIMTFHQLLQDIKSAKPGWNDTVSVVFDKPDPAWKSAICAAHSIVQAKQPNLRELVFSSKINRPELQAADMVAYRHRQLLERLSQDGLEAFPLPLIDQLIFASSFGQYARHGFNGPFLPPKFRKPKK